MDKSAASWVARMFGAASVALVVIFVTGIVLLHRANGTSAMHLAGAAMLAASLIGLVVILVALPTVLQLIESHRAETNHQKELMALLAERLQSLSLEVNMMSEQQLISDRAKQVAFREKDREAVRRAIREEIARSDWEAALVLANEIEAQFGYKQEADQWRVEINSKQDDVYRQRLLELLAPIDRFVQAESWGQAVQEAQRLMSEYPNDAQIARLPQEIENRRQKHKKQLRDSWQEAVNRHDVDGSIEILKKLDLYLTPAEAVSMQEIARNVFKEKRDALRTGFALAVQERNWALAIQLGDEIMSEFPNTRIAQEVREKMDVLRQRAQQPQIAGA